MVDSRQSDNLLRLWVEDYSSPHYYLELAPQHPVKGGGGIRRDVVTLNKQVIRNSMTSLYENKI